MKSDNRKKAGALQPVPLLERAWQQITTNLVTDLPESESKTVVVVFVDRLTKMVHFFPCTKEITATEYARLFINQVFRLHGMPEVIISYRDLRFVSKFWEEMFSLLGTDLRFSTAFHPKTVGSLRSPSECWKFFCGLILNTVLPPGERNSHWPNLLPIM